MNEPRAHRICFKNPWPLLSPRLRVSALKFGVAALLFPVFGCNIIGAGSSIIANAFPNKVAAQYKGLDGQTVAVMVWPERGIRIDYPYLERDVATGVQQKLKILQEKVNPPELKNTKFPITPETVVRYHDDHPEIEAIPIVDTAAKFDVSRLIYIEITDFATKSEASLLLSRGSMSGNLKVIEIKDGKAKIAYQEDDIHVDFPKDAPPEGLPDGDDYKVYQGTLDAYTTQMVYKFYDHEAEDK